MGFALPLAGSAARDAMGDIAHVVEILRPANAARLPDFRGAICAARRTLEANPAASRVNVICIRGDDERWLVSIGRRGGWKRLWNFGRG